MSEIPKGHPERVDGARSPERFQALRRQATGHAVLGSDIDKADRTPTRARGGVGAWVAHHFREREILIRSDDRVRFLRLKPWMQMTAVGMAVTVSVWAAATSGLSYWQRLEIADQRAEIVEAKLAYDRVRADLEVYRVRVGALAHDIFERQARLEADRARTAEDVEAADAAESVPTAPVGALADNLAVDLEELAEISTRIEGAFERIATDLDLTEADRQRIVQSRDALHERIQTLEEKLARADAREDKLSRRVVALDGQLTSERAAHDKAAERRDTLRETLEEARRTLAATARRETALRARVSALNGALDSADQQSESLTRERDALEGRLASLRQRLSDNKDRRKAIDKRIAEVVRDLAAVANAGLALNPNRDTVEALEVQVSGILDDLHRARRRADSADSTLSQVVVSLSRLAEETGAVSALESNKAGADGTDRTIVAALSGGADPVDPNRPSDAVARAEALLSEIEGLHDSQRHLVGRLSEETQGNISRTESLLRLAGLDVDRLLNGVGFEVGQGGPLVATDFVGPEQVGTETFADDVEELDDRLRRWRALQEVVRCVPLIPPLDNFHVTSNFGKRKDPFNGRWAMHEGVDLGGWPGTRILATAPGTVVRAGHTSGYGKMVEIDHGCGVRTIYAHLRRVMVEEGDVVDHRHVIGKLGSTGRSTGPHVHYEVQVDGEPLDPEKFIEAGKHVFKI